MVFKGFAAEAFPPKVTWCAVGAGAYSTVDILLPVL